MAEDGWKAAIRIRACQRHLRALMSIMADRLSIA